MNNIVEVSLHSKFFHSHSHQIRMKKVQIKKIGSREREHGDLEGKDRRFCFVQIVHGITDALWVCLKIYFV